MNKLTDAARVECNFCDVEHKTGDCLLFSTEVYDTWIQRHSMMPDITFHKNTREVKEK